MRQRSAIIALSALLLSTGCATVAHGVRQEVVVTSEPLGAAVFINDVAVGTTPKRVSFRRGESNVVVRFEKQGFASQRIALKRSISGWVALNGVVLNPMARQGMTRSQADAWPTQAVVSLAFMLGPDLATGGAYKLPKVVRAVLEPSPGRTGRN